MPKTCLFAALCAGFFAVPAAAQSFQQEISLFGLGNPLTPAKPFGLSYEATSDRIYVAIAGDFLGNNNAVAVIDPSTDTVVSTITVGLFPEDIAFSYNSMGALQYGAVTNSSSGSVTIWDATNQVVATVQLPDPFGLGSCFPFGIVAHQDKFWVSTQDGSGNVYAIDIPTLSFDAAASFNTQFLSGSRLKGQGNQLWIPTTEYLPSFTGAKGGLYRHDLAGIQGDEAWVAERRDQFVAYPSASEVEVLADGSAYLTGLDFSGHLYRVDAQGELDRAIDLEGVDGYGLALNPNQDILAIASLTANELVLVDVLNDELLSHTSVLGLGSGYMQPNDVVFVHGKIYMTVQSNEAVLVFNNLPTVSAHNDFRGSLTVSDTTPNRGDTVTIDLSGFSGQRVALMTSTNSSPTLYQGVSFQIGPQLVQRLVSATGNAQATLNLPLNAALEGKQFFLQGYVTDGVSDFTTAPKVLVIQ